LHHYTYISYHDSMEQNYIQIILPCQSTHAVTDRTLLVFRRFYVKLYIISLRSMQLRKPKKKSILVYISLTKFVVSPHVKTQTESRFFHFSPHRPITNDYANLILTTFQNNCCTMLDFQIQQHKTSDCDNAYMSKHEIRAPI